MTHVFNIKAVYMSIQVNVSNYCAVKDLKRGLCGSCRFPPDDEMDKFLLAADSLLSSLRISGLS